MIFSFFRRAANEADAISDVETFQLREERAPVAGDATRMPLAPTEDQIRAGEKTPRFAALQHPNFRLFWTGNLISLIGTMAQQTAQGWLTRDLTSDERLITAVSAAGTLPILLLTLYTGAVADRVDKRRTLVFTNSAAMLVSLLLAVLVWQGLIQVWHLLVIAVIGGVVNAFDIPTRQSFNVELVGREDLPNAIALNSSAFNGARVFGPMVGGFLLGHIGTAGCFFVNSLSFVALITNLLRLKTPPAQPAREPARLSDIKQGFNFVRRHPILRTTTLLVGWVSIFATPYIPLLPVFARDVFLTNEHGFATMATSNGLGGFSSAVALAVAGRMRHKGKRLLLGAFLFSLSVIAFGWSPTLPIGCFFLLLAGWFLLTFLMTANTLIQTLAPDDLRGRVFSVYSLAVIGTTPLGALCIGFASHLAGPRNAVMAGGAISAIYVFGVFLRHRELWKEK
jgi:MFS family permease